MFRAGLLLIIRRINCVLTAIRIVMLIGCCQQPINIRHDYANFCLHRVDPPDDEQQACSKHVEAYY